MRWLVSMTTAYVAVDPHRRFETSSPQHHSVAGSRDLQVGDVGFKPTDHEVQRGLMVNRMTFAPFMCIERFSGSVLGDEVWIALHCVDLASAEQWQGPGISSP
jgi:hypothetical protein